MAGRINDEDVATVRERARIEDIVGAHVMLRPAGGGALTGLCPFHDEKTPSFRVTPSKGFYYCFGCNEGGDVIRFVERINNMGFTEAVEFLADKVGIQLRYTEGGGVHHEPGLRMRILEANALAAEFFAGQLVSPDALVARQFLHERGFDRDAATHFGLGFAPRGGRVLRDFLLDKKFSREDMIAAGLVRESGWDFFQSRLLWPIRDAGRSVLGFGARRLFDDDRMPAKYINTPETMVYKKSTVLYGLDLARSEIGRRNQAVVVEGYTDVMACHLAGVETAVASCGTAFGEDHSRMIARLMTSDAHAGEVIFTFDGDEAGQKAALKVFEFDQKFTNQTYVAVDPNGLDPCDLRLQAGDAAVRDLVASRVPLYRFMMANVLSRFDLDRADGRLAAVREAAPLVASVRDPSLISGYVRDLAGMVGMDSDEVRREMASANRRSVPAEPQRPRHEAEAHAMEEQPWMMELPDPNDRSLEVERGTTQLLVQHPDLFDDNWDSLKADDFTHPSYRRVFECVTGLDRDSTDWVQQLRDTVADPVGDQLVVGLSVEPLRGEPSEGYAHQHAARLRLRALEWRITDLKSRLQRTNPVEHPDEHTEMFSRLLEWESLRRELQSIAIGDIH